MTSGARGGARIFFFSRSPWIPNSTAPNTEQPHGRGCGAIHILQTWLFARCRCLSFDPSTLSSFSPILADCLCNAVEAISPSHLTTVLGRHPSGDDRWIGASREGLGCDPGDPMSWYDPIFRDWDRKVSRGELPTKYDEAYPIIYGWLENERHKRGVCGAGEACR